MLRSNVLQPTIASLLNDFLPNRRNVSGMTFPLLGQS